MKSRLLSLDIFRGLTVATMILVNNPGNWDFVYAPLLHAHWNGCTPTDLVFPFFLFIVGVSIVFAMDGRPVATSKILRRSLTLFGLGFFLSFYPKFNIDTVRLFGVLQRIGIVYFCAAMLFTKTSARTQYIVAAAILLGYWGLLSLPVPDLGHASLALNENMVGWLDRTLFGEAHLYKGYDGKFDPEGLLSTLPAVVTSLLGIFVGRILKNNPKNLSLIMALGALLLAVGWLWGLVFPINKSLWTSSYVLFTGGLATIILLGFYYLIDVLDKKCWGFFFEVYGVNAIVVFFLSGFIPRTLNLFKIAMPDGKEVSSQKYFQDTFIGSHFSDPYQASLAVAVFYITVWFIVLYVMYRRKIFIKV